MNLKITQGPWHYINGAVWGNPKDAEAVDGTAIAVRGVQRNPNIPDQFEPTTKDANMRFIAHAPATFAALEKLAGMAELVQVDLDESMTGWYHQFKQALHEANMQMRRVRESQQ